MRVGLLALTLTWIGLLGCLSPSPVSRARWSSLSETAGESAPTPPTAEAIPAKSPVTPPTILAVEPLQPAVRARHILALSGGGSYGAFTAGVLSGWSRSNQRPLFDVVTGISTGALIAPMAFLGPDYDANLKRFYTEVSAKDVFRFRSLWQVPFQPSVANLTPLRAILEINLTEEVVQAIAREHRKGRRLYVATTHLQTRRLVVWDLGALACRGTQADTQRILQIILASASVPGMFEPVPLTIELDGVSVTEWHVDSGVTAPLFIPPGVLEQSEPGVQVYALIAGKLYPSPDPVPPRVLKVVTASGIALMHAYTRSQVSGLAQRTQANGGDFHLMHLRQGFTARDNGVQFHTDEMNRLFVEGVRLGLGPEHTGPVWSPWLDESQASDGPEIRTGHQLWSRPGEPR